MASYLSRWTEKRRWIPGSTLVVAATLLVIGVLVAQPPTRSVVPPASADVDQAGALAWLRDVYSQAGRQPGVDSAYYLDYTMVVQPRDTSLGHPDTTQLSLVMAGTTMAVRSPLFEMYQDSGSVYAVIKPSRTIFVNAQLGPLTRTMQVSNLFILRDSVLNGCSVEASIDSMDRHGTRVRRLVLGFDPVVRTTLGIARMEIVAEIESRRMRKVVMAGSPESIYTSVEMLVSRMEFDVTPEDLRANAASHLFTDKGTLTREFRGFTVVDNRTRTPDESY